MKPSRKRTYSVPQFLSDVSAVVSNPRVVFKVADLPAPFRERLMLAVTAVNECRYCSYFHARQAVRAGLAREEVDHLLEGVIENVPLDEAAAVFYAQHWAEHNGDPDPAVRARLVEGYGEEKVQVIEMALLLIRIANLSGNSYDVWLARVSGGRWGGAA